MSQCTQARVRRKNCSPPGGFLFCGTRTLFTLCARVQWLVGRPKNEFRTFSSDATAAAVHCVPLRSIFFFLNNIYKYIYIPYANFSVQHNNNNILTLSIGGFVGVPATIVSVGRRCRRAEMIADDFVNNEAPKKKF